MAVKAQSRPNAVAFLRSGVRKVALAGVARTVVSGGRDGVPMEHVRPVPQQKYQEYKNQKRKAPRRIILKNLLNLVSQKRKQSEKYNIQIP